MWHEKKAGDQKHIIDMICEKKEGIQRVSITIPAADPSASFLPSLSFRFSTTTQQPKTLKIEILGLFSATPI